MGVAAGAHPLKSPQSDTCLAWAACKTKVTLTVRDALGVGACAATGAWSGVFHAGRGAEGFGGFAEGLGSAGVAADGAFPVTRSCAIRGLYSTGLATVNAEASGFVGFLYALLAISSLSVC